MKIQLRRSQRVLLGQMEMSNVLVMAWKKHVKMVDKFFTSGMLNFPTSRESLTMNKCVTQDDFCIYISPKRMIISAHFGLQETRKALGNHYEIKY